MRILFTFIIIALLCASSGVAQEMPIPLDIQQRLLTKILTFDRTLQSRAGSILTIGVIYQKYFRTSLNVETELLRIFSESGIKMIDDIPIKIVPLQIQTGDDIDNLISTDDIDIVYIAPLRGIDLNTMIARCHTRKVITYSGIPEYVDAGVAIAIDRKGDNPQIIINIEAVKKCGADFTSQLLKLSKIIR